ncbi:MAG: 6-carboxytetrahydropterin synthase [Akkermansiaceae bacterium]|nr:6-carboxytetrahydropterin synthase [Verrucomicrobiales bacterium]
MFRLTRDVRFAINDAEVSSAVTNGFGGVPAVLGFGHWFAMQITLEGTVSASSGYLRNITEIDQAVRERVIPVIRDHVHGRAVSYARALGDVWRSLDNAWPGSRLVKLNLQLSPYLSIAMSVSEIKPEILMIRLSQKFEFSAAHRLHNPLLSDEENRETFGKCNNLHGHGHNYELQVTLAGAPGTNGDLMAIQELEHIVQRTVIDRFDHKFLNIEVAEFATLNPSVENIARTIYQLLEAPLARTECRLAAITVWETPKTWCEYSQT